MNLNITKVKSQHIVMAKELELLMQYVIRLLKHKLSWFKYNFNCDIDIAEHKDVFHYILCLMIMLKQF